MKKKIILKWGLRATVLAAGGFVAYTIKSRKDEVERLKGELERATAALESQNRVMRSLQRQLGIQVDEGSD